MNNIALHPVRYNILIVDDIPTNLKILDGILKGDGYKVRPVPNGLLALQAAEKERPDLILLDIMMPEMDGYEVCRKLKENPELVDVPVIFISALNDTQDIVKAFTSGGVDYITKPFQAEEVKARVATHLKICRQNLELKQLNAEKDKFFSIIAHDLRSPFTGFLGLTQILEEQLSDLSKEEILDFSTSMRISATKLFTLLENLLEWARIQQGLIPFTPETVQLLAVVNESIGMIKENASLKQIEIIYDIPDEITVFTDTNILQTILRNLVSNAVKFTSKNGSIIISVLPQNDGSMVISIKDTGIGMSQHIMDNLFRIDVNTSRKGTDGETSTGLGLIICKDFIEKHGGKLWVESEVGKGSSFNFTLGSKN
ncbi:MAG: hybrid sensor histidine kinase/response regulator [Bacteroidales bacterium]